MSHPLLEGALIRPSGEGAFAVEFGDSVDPALTERVRALDAALAEAAPKELWETVPTHRSLLILHDPDLEEPEALLSALPDRVPPPPEPTTWGVPVCLEGAAAEDAEEAAGILGISPGRLAERLAASPLRVAMFGFAPGLAYLSGLDPALHLPRRATPRPPMPAGSLIIAGGQAALASAPMPTGWYVVGRSMVRLFNPERDPMVPFAPGDRIALHPVPDGALEGAEPERMA